MGRIVNRLFSASAANHILCLPTTCGKRSLMFRASAVLLMRY